MKTIFKHLEYILILPLIAFSIYLGFLNDYIMFFIGLGFILSFVSYLLLIFKNKKVKLASGIISLLNGPYFIIILLLFCISMLGVIVPLYYLIYSIAYFIFKVITIIYYANQDDIESIYYKEYALLMVFYLFNLIFCILLYNFNSGETLFYMIDVLTRVFVDNYTQYDTLKFYLIIIKIVVNFITSNFVAYYTASALITISKNEKLKLKDKIKAVTNFFIKYNIGFIFVELFTFIIMLNYASNMNSTNSYAVMAFYYLIILVLRLLVVIWNFILKKKYKDNQYKIYRRRFILLIITATTFLISFNALNSVFVYISENNAESNVPLLWLVLIVLPFSGYGFINSILSVRKAKIEDNAYSLSISTISFVSSIYMLFGALMYLLVSLDDTAKKIIIFIIISIATASMLFIIIRALVIGIKGISGKRKKESDFQKDEIEKEDLV